MQSYREFLCSDIADTAKNKQTIEFSDPIIRNVIKVRRTADHFV